MNLKPGHIIMNRSDPSNQEVYRVVEVGEKITVDRLTSIGWVNYGQLKPSSIECLAVYEPVEVTQ
jgi:hypothetical protein